MTIELSPVSVEYCIFAYDLTGAGVEYTHYTSDPIRTCNLYWGNADGAVQGSPIQSDDLTGDPFFCYPEGGQFTIAANSLAAPENNPCGVLIGAYPVACDATATEEASWSRIKSLY